MAATTIDNERLADILVDAVMLGDPKAAERWQISDRTIRNYRERMRSDPALAAIFQQKRGAHSARLAEARERLLMKSLAKLEALVDVAGPDQIRDVAGVVKIVGDLHVVDRALATDHDEQPGPDQSGSWSATRAGVAANAVAGGPH